MEVFVGILTNIVDNSPNTFRASPIQIKGEGKLNHITATLDTFRISSDIQANISVDMEQGNFETSVEICGKASATGSGNICLAGRCLGIPSEPANALLPKGFTCQKIIRRLQDYADFHILQSELYRLLTITLGPIPISLFTKKIFPILHAIIAAGTIGLLASFVAAGTAFYLTRKKLKRRKVRIGQSESELERIGKDDDKPIGMSKITELLENLEDD